jgi:hypothetical protein
MKAYGEMDVQIRIFLASALVAGEWLLSRPVRFKPEGKSNVPIGEEARWPLEPA